MVSKYSMSVQFCICNIKNNVYSSDIFLVQDITNPFLQRMYLKIQSDAKWN